MKGHGSGEEPCMEKEIGARFATTGSQDQGLRPATHADGDGLRRASHGHSCLRTGTQDQRL